MSTDFKKQVLTLAPDAYSQARYEITNVRTFYVCSGSRTLGRGISAQKAWEKALKVLEQKEANDLPDGQIATPDALS